MPRTHSSTHTNSSGTIPPASLRQAALSSSSRSFLGYLWATFFERPLPRKPSDRPTHRGSRDPDAALLFECLAVFFKGEVGVVLELCSGSHAASTTTLRAVGPGTPFLGSKPPVSLLSLSQRLMEGTDTEKVFATSFRGTPRSTAASTRDLRSIEYGFMPGVSLRINGHASRCQKGGRRWPLGRGDGMLGHSSGLRPSLMCVRTINCSGGHTPLQHLCQKCQTPGVS
jgi:hypothetical protein